MLTLNCARVASIVARAGATAALSAIAVAAICGAADADGLVAGGCLRAGISLNCVVRWGAPEDPYVRTVPQSKDKDEQSRAADRDHRWEQRCKPTIAQDRYGVPRYVYSAPGCEFGVIQ